VSVFESIMLICFGAAWPFSIYKAYVSKQNAGKSLLFLHIVLVGYVCGVIHKFRNDFDIVTYLYVFNGLMVLADIMLYYRNSRLEKSEPQ